MGGPDIVVHAFGQKPCGLGPPIFPNGRRAGHDEPPRSTKRAKAGKTPEPNERAIVAKTPRPTERATEHEAPIKDKRARLEETPNGKERANRQKTPRPIERANEPTSGRHPDCVSEPTLIERTGMQKTMKLSQLKMDPDLLRLRPLNEVAVSRYRKAAKLGADLTERQPLIIDAKTRIIVSGNHRVKALRTAFGDKYEVEVEARKFKTRAELLKTFAEQNTERYHGVQLNGSSQRAIALELVKENVDPEEVADLFQVSVREVTKWGDMTVVLVGGDQDGESVPIKRGLEVRGQEVTSRQYNEHWKKDRGVPVKSQAAQLTRWLDNDWVQPKEQNLEALAELEEALERWKNRNGVTPKESA